MICHHRSLQSTSAKDEDFCCIAFTHHQHKLKLISMRNGKEGGGRGKYKKQVVIAVRNYGQD